MSQALYRKWRPARFDQVIGQEHITRTLQNSVAADRVGHAYLFCGPRGTGKTTSARLLAKAVNCLHDNLAERPCDQCSSCLALNNGRFLDLIEIDAASNTGVDDIRDLRDKINFSPNLARFKVYIIDEVHMLSTAAFNALLKTLEEPPGHAMFILATTEEHKVPLTIKSRCQQFNFRLLTIAEISARLNWLAEQESLDIEPEALELIARQGAGSLRDAESLLDQLVVAPGDTITLERAQMVLGTASNTAVLTLIDAWLNADGAAGLDIIHNALASGTDARQFCRQMVGHLRHLLLLQAAGMDLVLDVTADHKANLLAQAQRAPRDQLITAIKGFNAAALHPAASWQPQLPLELAFIEMLPDTPAPTVQMVVKEVTAQPAVAAMTTQPPKAQVKAAPVQELPPPAPEFKEISEPILEETAVVTKAVVEKRPLQLEAVKTQWRAMLAQIGQRNKNLPPLLAMSQPLGVEGNTLILGFDYPIFKKKFDDTADAAATIGAVYSELLHAQCQVRCVITSEYSVPINRAEFDALAQELGGIVREE
ncbi:MAG: DNA polymerase III subunit gamma/tau [Anaerolineales bacterium]|nr:DNA polymerase III subunit gamma/tau [Anaerolineales bacterium]